MKSLLVAVGPHLIDLERVVAAERLPGNRIFRVHVLDAPPLDLTGVESQTMRLIVIACDALTRRRLGVRIERLRREAQGKSPHPDNGKDNPGD